jgi:hypothetical protein
MDEISDSIHDIMFICYLTMLSVPMLYYVYVGTINEYETAEWELVGKNIVLGEILPRATFSTSNPRPIDFSSKLGPAVGHRLLVAWSMAMTESLVFMYVCIYTYIY